jgi:threonine dehydratase
VAGIAMALGEAAPSARVFSVEPAGFDDTALSLASGARERVAVGAQSFCDALLAPSPGELTFPINNALLAGGLVVDDKQVRGAIGFAHDQLGIVAEPGGAVALAAALAGLAPAGDGALVIVVSGANVDPEVHAAILQTPS